MRYTVILAVIALVASLAAAQAAPATIEGSWRGSGMVTYGNGADMCNVACDTRERRQSPSQSPPYAPPRAATTSSQGA
jgi:hypothetical protein